MATMPIDPDIQRRLLARYLAGSAPDPVGVRTLAARFCLIPVHLDAGGFVGLREDGELLLIDWDAPWSPTVLTDAHQRRVALAAAAEEFPELAFLTPPRPPDAVACPYCGGSWRVTISGAEAPPNVNCYCGGLGWVLPGEVVED